MSGSDGDYCEDYCLLRCNFM